MSKSFRQGGKFTAPITQPTAAATVAAVAVSATKTHFFSNLEVLSFDLRPIILLIF